MSLRLKMQRTYLPFWIATLVLTIASCNGKADKKPDFEAAISSLKEGSPNEEIEAALLVLETAGKDAFPALLLHIDDQTHAANDFQRQLVTADGELYLPKIGDVCFDILHGQIEGNWPKSCRKFYFLNQGNVVEWWDKNKLKSLPELRRQCAAESLKQAQETFESPDNKFTRIYATKIIEFLESNLAEAQNSQ